MPRISEPLPGEIGSALRRLRLTIYNGFEYRGAFDIVRAYDRSSGNFKAFGWKMTLGYGVDLDDPTTFATTLTICLPDGLLAFEQSTLERFEP